jgi:hypothetical protein
MGWEQFVYLFLLFGGVGIAIGKWGQPREYPYGWIDVISAAIVLGLLFSGGFFGG